MTYMYVMYIYMKMQPTVRTYDLISKYADYRSHKNNSLGHCIIELS